MGGTSSIFPVILGVRQGWVHAPSHFNSFMDWVLGRAIDWSHCGPSLGSIMVTDLICASHGVIFTGSKKVLVIALEPLQEEAKPLGFKISEAKTKVQVFGACWMKQ